MEDEKFAEKVFSKLDDMSKDIVELKITSAKQEVNVAEHIRRTNLLETVVMLLQTKMNYIEGACKFIGAVAVVVAAIESFTKAWVFVSHFVH